MTSAWSEILAPDSPPQRSLHAGAVLNDHWYIFGGYDGSVRTNDLHRFNFASRLWTKVHASNCCPSPRDRHTLVAWRNGLYLFGGSDKTTRSQELWRFDTSSLEWTCLSAEESSIPTARHSHSAVVADNKLFVLFGYDGAYRSDVHEFSFRSSAWRQLGSNSTHSPPGRYRSACALVSNKIYIFGGHDGTRHLDDFWCFDIASEQWTEVVAQGQVSSMGSYVFRATSPSLSQPPSARDSHSAVVVEYDQGEGNIENQENAKRKTKISSIVVFGGSGGGHAKNDIFEYRIDLNAWFDRSDFSKTKNLTPSVRFCHTACTYRNCMYVYAGYNGSKRLGDLWEFSLTENSVLELPLPTILDDLLRLCASGERADVAFVLDDGSTVFAHKAILSIRCPFFKAMFESNMREASQKEISLPDILEDTLNAVLRFIYTDELALAPLRNTLDEAAPERSSNSLLPQYLQVMIAADRFALTRLKKICECKVVESINQTNVCNILQAGDMHNSHLLKRKALDFVKRHFDSVINTPEFEDLARTNVELTLEIIRHRRK